MSGMKGVAAAGALRVGGPAANWSPLNRQAWVLMTLPTLDAFGSSLANACRKPLSDTDPLLPPRALTRLSKLLCRVLCPEFAAASPAPLVEAVDKD